MATDDPTEKRASKAKATPPDDAEDLQQEIDQTRQQLADTVDQLTAKADVKARAQKTATELADRAKSTARQAAHGASAVRDQVTDKAAEIGQKAKSAGTRAADQLPKQVAAAAAPLRNAVPEPAERAVARTAGAVRRWPVPAAVAIGVFIAGVIVARRWRKR